MHRCDRNLTITGASGRTACLHDRLAGHAPCNGVLVLVTATLGAQARLSTRSNSRTWRDEESDLATQAFLFDQTCWRPQRGQRIGKFISGRLSNITESVVRPVGIGRFVTGHIVMISLTLPSPNYWGTRR